MAYNTRGFFNSTIKEIYQQTGALLSLEGRENKDLLILSLKNFEANVVYNWQKIVFPIFNGVVGSPHVQYSGFRSKPWAEYDVLDSVYGGISGWTITAEPWATENGLPALWDEVNNQPHSITGALYYLAKKIENLEAEEAVEEEADAIDLTGQVNCLEANLETIFKDVYGCGYTLDCDSIAQKQYSIYTHIKQIFDQLVDGAPTLSVDTSCEDTYPNMSLYMPTSGLTYDVQIPGNQVSGCSGVNATIVDDLAVLRTFVGMSACDSVTAFSQHLQSPEVLNYIADTDSLEVTCYKLDQAIAALGDTINNLTVASTLQEAYDHGDQGSNSPGSIFLTNPTGGGAQAGITLIGHEANPDVSTDPLETPYFRIRDTVRGPLYGGGKYGNEPTASYHRVNQLFAVTEHPVSLSEPLDSSTGLLTDTDLRNYQYPAVHLYRSILMMQTTGGFPHTRPYGSIPNTGSFNEVAIWASTGKLKSGASNATYFDCDSNLVGDDNLYYRKPNSGEIYKLNKCGETINVHEAALELEELIDFPRGGPVKYDTVKGWCPGVVYYERPDLGGVCFGWNADNEDTDATPSDTVVEAREITTGSEKYTGSGVKAGLTVRTLTDNGKGVIKFLEGPRATFEDQGEINVNGDRMALLTKGQERMVLIGGSGSDKGYVGINVEAPEAQLHVRGCIKADCLEVANFAPADPVGDNAVEVDGDISVNGNQSETATKVCAIKTDPLAFNTVGQYEAGGWYYVNGRDQVSDKHPSTPIREVDGVSEPIFTFHGGSGSTQERILSRKTAATTDTVLVFKAISDGSPSGSQDASVTISEITSSGYHTGEYEVSINTSKDIFGLDFIFKTGDDKGFLAPVSSTDFGPVLSKSGEFALEGWMGSKRGIGTDLEEYYRFIAVGLDPARNKISAGYNGSVCVLKSYHEFVNTVTSGSTSFEIPSSAFGAYTPSIKAGMRVRASVFNGAANVLTETTVVSKDGLVVTLADAFTAAGTATLRFSYPLEIDTVHLIGQGPASTSPPNPNFEHFDVNNDGMANLNDIMHYFAYFVEGVAISNTRLWDGKNTVLTVCGLVFQQNDIYSQHPVYLKNNFDDAGGSADNAALIVKSGSSSEGTQVMNNQTAPGSGSDILVCYSTDGYDDTGSTTWTTIQTIPYAELNPNNWKEIIVEVPYDDIGQDYHVCIRQELDGGPGPNQGFFAVADVCLHQTRLGVQGYMNFSNRSDRREFTGEMGHGIKSDKLGVMKVKSLGGDWKRIAATENATFTGDTTIDDGALRVKNKTSNHELKIQASVSNEARILAHNFNQNVPHPLKIGGNTLKFSVGSAGTIDAMLIDSTGNIDINNDITIGGDLTVNGTTTTVNSTVLQVDDINIELGTVDTPSDTTADGGGITLKGATDKEFKWINSTGLWTTNVGLDVGGGVTIGNSSSTTAGTIRWSGSDLEAYKAGGWVSLTATGTGGGISNLVEDLSPELGADLDAVNNSIDNINTLNFKDGPAVKSINYGRALFLDPAVGAANAANAVRIGGIGLAAAARDNNYASTGNLNICQIEAESGKSLVLGASAFANTSAVQINSGTNASFSGTSREGIEFRMREGVGASGAIASVSIKSTSLNADDSITSERSPELRFYNPDGHYVSLKAPGDSTISGNVDLVLPETEGTDGQVLQTNGSGSLSFADPVTQGAVSIDMDGGPYNIHHSDYLNGASRITKVIVYRTAGSSDALKFNCEAGFKVGDSFQIHNMHQEMNLKIEVVDDSAHTSTSLQSKFKGAYTVTGGVTTGTPFGTQAALNSFHTFELASGKTLFGICESVDAATGQATFVVYRA